jgi:hypothetical protein
MSQETLRCPVCGAADHEREPDLFGIFPVILCPQLEEQRIVLEPASAEVKPDAT